MASVSLLDVRQGALGEEPAAEGTGEEGAAVAAPDGVDERGAADVADPGDGEDDPGIERAAPRQKGAERDRDIGGGGGEDVFDGGEATDERVQRNRREGLQEPQQIGQVRASSSSATAITAMPSPRPMNPIPSLVFALTERLEKPAMAASASFSRISST